MSGVADELRDFAFAVGRLQTDATMIAHEEGDRHGKHAQALRRLIERVEYVADDMERGGWLSTRLDNLRAAIQEAREATDG